jgi:GNAT superfamily N-acetyltransferase
MGTAAHTVTYLDLNADPHGGRVNLPHWHITRESGNIIGVLVISDRKVIELLYVIPGRRREGIAAAMLANARRVHGRGVGTDDRLSADGVAFFRRYRVPFYADGTRRVILDAEYMEHAGTSALDRATRLLTQPAVAA